LQDIFYLLFCLFFGCCFGLWVVNLGILNWRYCFCLWTN
jgi:hypothetical protein